MPVTTARTLARTLGALALAAGGVAAPISPATAAPPAPPGSAGCAAPSAQQPGTSVDRTLVSGGRERAYRVHLPEEYAPGRAWPVVLVFHGRGNDAARTEEFSGMSDLPAVVVYPEGEIGTGDGERQAWQGAPYEPPGVDDVAFTADLLDEVESSWCVDTRRVYASGKSNGAGFTGLLACRMADRITAVAPVAGAFYPGTREGCSPSRPVPVLEVHGTDDATIPYDGDAERDLPAVTDHVAGWASRDGCHAGPLTHQLSEDVVEQRWVGCARGTSVEHVAVLGGGHTWPGEDAYSGGGYATQSIEGSEVVWDFLRRHRLPVHQPLG